MKFILFLTVLIISLAAFNRAKSAPIDSAKSEIKIPTFIKYIDHNAFSSQQITFHLLDTSLNNLQHINPATTEYANYLSNFGSATSSQVIRVDDNLFTDVGFHTYDLYLFNENKIRYFKTNKAYSEISYHLAAGKEQQITVALSENIFKTWNAGLDFNRLGSLGFLKNGTTYQNSFDLYSWIHSVNNRYNLFVFSYWNTIENHVNGGVHNDSLYDHSIVSNLALQGLLVNLTEAENHFRNNKLSLRQYYDLGFKTEEHLSDTVKKYHFKPSFRIEHSISLEKRAFTYLDNNTGDYYRHTYLTPSTLDSLHFYDLRNRLSLASHGNNKRHPEHVSDFNFSIAWEHQWLRYSQFAKDNLQFLDTIMQNNAVLATLGSREDTNRISGKLSGTYIFEGVNKDNYKGDLSVQLPVYSYGVFSIAGQVLLKSPEFIYQRYYSNHFIWENNFQKSQWKNIRITYLLPSCRFSAFAELTSVSNFIYLDSAASPAQSTNELQILKYNLEKNLVVGKIHFNNAIIVQQVNDADMIHLPSFLSTQSLFYESFFYNNALLLQTGFDFHFHSSYYADAFMPATGLFYRQEEKKTGGYSLVDFFLNFRIKTARFFLKLENIGDNLIQNGYYLTPGYPMQGMTLKFGVNWRFFDQ